MKILYVYGNLPSYRKEFFTDLYNSAIQKGVSVKILYGLIANKETKQALDISFETQKFDTRFLNLKLFRLSRMKGVLRQVKKEKPDGVIFQWNQTNLSEWAILLYCKCHKIPYGLWGCNYTRSDLIKPLARIRESIYVRLYRKAAVLIPYGSLYKDHLLKCGIDESKIILAQNTIDVETIIRNSPAKTVESFNHDTLRILYVGALAPQKRIDSAIEAVSQLICEGVDVSLDVVGGGRNLDNLKNQLSSKTDDVKARITLHGAKYGVELRDCFINSDVFLMPGTGGLGVNEAMAYGLPIISTIGDETVYDLIDGNGYLLGGMGCVEEQIEAIKKFAALSNNEKYNMSKRSVEIIKTKASLRNMVNKHLAAFDIILKKD